MVGVTGLDPVNSFRPPACKAEALPAELYSQISGFAGCRYNPMYEIRRGVGPLNPHHLSNVTASQAALPQSTCFTIILLGRTTLNKSFSYFPLQQRRVCPVWSDAVWSCVAITHPHQSNVVSAAKRHSRYSQSFAYRPSYAGVTDIPLDCTFVHRTNLRTCAAPATGQHHHPSVAAPAASSLISRRFPMLVLYHISLYLSIVSCEITLILRVTVRESRMVDPRNYDIPTF